MTMSRVIYSFPVTIIVLHKYRSKLLPGCSSSLERLPSNKDSFVKQILNPLAWEQEQKHVWWQLITRVNICEDQVLSLVWGRCLVPLITALLWSKGWTMGVDEEGGRQPGTLIRVSCLKSWHKIICVRQSRAWEQEDEEISQQPHPQ